MSTSLEPRRFGALALTAAASLALFGCASTPNAPTALDSSQSVEQATVVETTDLWVKAAEDGMTAGFGVITNTGADAIAIVSIDSEAAASMELHETVDDGNGQMMMREIDGFDIAPGASLTLEPGGNHFMIMGLHAPIAAGDEVAMTMTFADGSTAELTALGKEFAGANETYDDDESDLNGDTSEGDH